MISYFKISRTKVLIHFTENGKSYTTNLSDVPEDTFETFFQLIDKYNKQSSKSVKRSVKDKLFTYYIKDPIKDLENIVASYNELEIKGNSKLVVKGSEEPMPKVLRNKFIDLCDKGFKLTPFIKFWKRLICNPCDHVRQNLYDHIEKYNLTVTTEGYVVLYKVVTSRDRSVLPYYDENPNKGLAQFVSEKYSEIKRKKQAPKHYFIAELEDGFNLYDSRIKTKPEDYFDNYFQFIENDTYNPVTLEDLYNDIENLSEEEGLVFTDKWSGSMTIKLGKPVPETPLPDDKVDTDPNVGCSKGLHLGSYKYVKSYGNPSDYVLLCLANPMLFVALPECNNSKIRMRQYIPISLVEKDGDGDWKPIDISLLDHDYKDIEEKALEELLKEQSEDSKKLTLQNRLKTIT